MLVPIGHTLCVGPHNYKNLSPKNVDIRRYVKNQPKLNCKSATFFNSSKIKCSKIKQLLKVEIEDWREAS